MNQFFKLKQPTVNTSPQQKPIANTSKSNEMIPFSTMDFFDRFVRQANDKKLLKTPLPTPLSKQHILLSSIQLLQASQLDKKDVRIEEDNYGGTIMITQRGLDKVQDFLSFRLQDKAATTIQKVWRGYRVRAKNQEFMYFEQYIQTLSLMYYDILNANRTSGPKLAPTQKELDFMKKLNHPETYRICQDYLLLLAEMEEVILFNLESTETRPSNDNLTWKPRVPKHNAHVSRICSKSIRMDWPSVENSV
jgi:hypothetical protein